MPCLDAIIVMLARPTMPCIHLVAFLWSNFTTYIISSTQTWYVPAIDAQDNQSL